MVDKDVIIARLLRQNEQLTHQNQLLIEENQKLRERIARLEKNSSNSSKPPSSDIINPKPPAKNGLKRKRGGQKGHKKYNRELFPEEAIDKTIVHKLPKDEIEHKKLITLDQTELAIQQVDLPEKLYTVTEHRVQLYHLKACGHMSYSTLQAFFDDVMNFDISSGYLVKCCTQKFSPALISSYEEALQYIRNAPIVGSDETGHKNPAYKSTWTWCEHAGNVVFFHINQSRGSKVLLELLGEDFEGILHVDYFSANKKFVKDYGIKVQYCWAHLIRDIKFLAEL